MTTKKHPKATASKRRTFDSSFKFEAVDLGKRIGIRKAAEDLGISEPNLRNWTKAVEGRGAEAFMPSSQRTDLSAENKRLQEEVRILRMERDILKKATVYFAKESK